MSITDTSRQLESELKLDPAVAIERFAVEAKVVPPLEAHEIVAISGLLRGSEPIDSHDHSLRSDIILANHRKEDGRRYDPRSFTLYAIWRALKPVEKIET